MKAVAVLLFVGACLPACAHDVITTKVTWSREISRLLFKRCTSCHRDGGSSFSLTQYQQARPWAKAIKEETLERRMPPWGAAKGFGDLRDDLALTQEQLELISDWVEGGAPEGDPALLPKDADANPPPAPAPKNRTELLVDGSAVLKTAATFVGIRPESLLEGCSMKVVAARPDGTIEPLIWIYNYNPKFDRAYYFRKPLALPAGARIETSAPGAGSFSLLQL